MRIQAVATFCGLQLWQLSTAVNFDSASDSSIKNASSLIAGELGEFYKLAKAPGLLYDPYKWWEGAALAGTWINYWRLTGDQSYVKSAQDALYFQLGSGSFDPTNQTSTLANSDQALWALASISATIYEFPLPNNSAPVYSIYAANAFNAIVPRWDTSFCGGGFRFQVNEENAGYNYKDVFSNGLLALLSSKLAFHTGNGTYLQWADKTFAWMQDVNLIDASRGYEIVNQGISGGESCGNPISTQYSFASAAVLAASAYAFNATNGDSATPWKSRLDGLLNGIISTFFSDSGLAVEASCEAESMCNVDQRAYKGLALQLLGETMDVAPYTADRIIPLFKNSSVAAAHSCTGGSSGLQCGFAWTPPGGSKFDGSAGVGEQLNALQAVINILPRLPASKLISNMTTSSETPSTTRATGTRGATPVPAPSPGSGTMIASVTSISPSSFPPSLPLSPYTTPEPTGIYGPGSNCSSPNCTYQAGTLSSMFSSVFSPYVSGGRTITAPEASATSARNEGVAIIGCNSVFAFMGALAACALLL